MSISPENKIKNQQAKIDATKFINPESPQHAYILGFIWSDGHLQETKPFQYRILVEITQKDMLDIKPVFDYTGQWSFHYRNREGRTPQACASCINDLLSTFLNKYDYKNKSQVSPRIYNDIPDNLKSYFLRGLIDGDGSYYYNNKTYMRQFSITSSYDQDWSVLEAIFEAMAIKFTVKRSITNVTNKQNKKNSYSQLRVTNKQDITKLHNFIYGETYDGIGLTRKYLKSLEIVES